MDTRSTLSARDESDAMSAALPRAPAPEGRLAMYATLGGAATAIPLPWLPDSLLHRVRGAVAHDVASRRGFSLTPEAREVLASPAGPDRPRSLAERALRFVGLRIVVRALTRFGPLALVWPLRHALQVYALGHLFERYLERPVAQRAVRIDEAEARRIRRAIDRAVVSALSAEAPPMGEPAPIDDQRDAATVVVDGLLGLVADLPSRVLRRLQAAFDEQIEKDDG